MGVARLLAKGWIVFCLFAGAHAFNFALARGEAPAAAAQSIGICLALFAATGLLFAAGFGAFSAGGGKPFLARLKPHHLVPRFNEVVFLLFVAASFAAQVAYAPAMLGGAIPNAVQGAIAAVVPGQVALAARLDACTLDGGRVFAAAFAWLLAIIFVASAVSRIGLTAGLLRLERTLRPSSFGPTVLAGLYGIAAIVGFQLLFVGSAYPWIPCSIYTDLTGAVLIGLAPLALAYLIVTALVTLRASAPEAE
ncbi:MAG: hypothetical protein WDM91_11510 [Rhizomicrobium sp.]